MIFFGTLFTLIFVRCTCVAASQARPSEYRMTRATLLRPILRMQDSFLASAFSTIPSAVLKTLQDDFMFIRRSSARSSSVGLKRASYVVPCSKAVLLLLGFLFNHPATAHASSHSSEPAPQQLLPSMGQHSVFPSPEHDRSSQHGWQWDAVVTTATSSELWAPESLAAEYQLSADDTPLSQEGPPAASIFPVSVSTRPRKDETRRRPSLLSKSLASFVLVACLALLLLRRGKAEKAPKPRVLTLPDQQALPLIECDLELLKKVCAAAEHLDALVGEPKIEELAMIIGRRVKQVEEAYAVLQQEASKQLGDQPESDPSPVLVARLRVETEMKALLEEANQLLALTLPCIRHFPDVPASKADALQESAKATKALWAAAFPHFSGAHIALVDHFAADAEASKREVSVLANLAEKVANATANSLSDALDRLERTAVFVARMARLSWNCTKDEDLFLQWNEVATDRVKTASRIEGAQLRATVDILRELASPTNFNPEAAAVASQFTHQLNEIQQIHEKSPTIRQLVVEEDSIKLLMMVEKLKVAEKEAREKTSSVLDGIKAKLSADSNVREAQLYKEDEITTGIFSGLAETTAALAEGSASLALAYSNQAPNLQKEAHRQIKSARRMASLGANNAVAEAKEARSAAKWASEASTCYEAHRHLMTTSNFYQSSVAAIREVGQQGLREAAWEYLESTAREARRQIADATKRLILEEEGSSEASAKVANIQNRACMLLEKFSDCQDLTVALGYVLELRKIMKQMQ
ncbi:hypothetical protein Esti_000150 [Eimeria stiedai]